MTNVSVIVPAYEAAGTIESCLDSIGCQTHAPHEIIVVDNASSDSTADVAQRWFDSDVGRTRNLVGRVVYEPTAGAYAARNRGLEEATGDVCLFVDADCRADETLLAEVVRHLNDPEVLIVGAQILGEPSQAALTARYAVRTRMLDAGRALRDPRGRYIQGGAVGARRDEVVLVGGFDDQLLSGGDFDFSRRMDKAFPGRRMVITSASVTHRHAESVRHLFRQFRRYGQGSVAMMRRHGSKLDFETRRLITDVGRISTLAPALTLGGIKALVTRDPLDVAQPALTALQIAAFRLGQLQALSDSSRLDRV